MLKSARGHDWRNISLSDEFVNLEESLDQSERDAHARSGRAHLLFAVYQLRLRLAHGNTLR